MKNQYHLWTSVAGILMGSTAVAADHNADERSYEESEFQFTYGENCERLQDVPEDTIDLITSSVYRSDFAHFCMAELPEDCADFSVLVQEYGKLVPSWDEGFCHFVPARIVL